MSRREYCPHPEFSESWIDLPDEWLGKHAIKEYEMRRQLEEKGIEAPLVVNFFVGLALLDDFDLQGLGSKSENFDINEIDVRILFWVGQVTLVEYRSTFIIPKASAIPPPDGQDGESE